MQNRQDALADRVGYCPIGQGEAIFSECFEQSNQAGFNLILIGRIETLQDDILQAGPGLDG